MFFRRKNNESKSLRRRLHERLLSRRREKLPTTIQRDRPIKAKKFLAKILASPRLFILRQFFFFFVVIGLLVGFFYVAFFSSFFDITKISLGKEGIAVSASDLAPYLDKLKAKNLLFLQTKNLEHEIEQAFRNLILMARIKKSYPHRVTVVIEEYPAVFNLQIISPDRKIKQYVLNSTGYSIFEDAESKDLPKLIWKTDKSISGKGIIIEPKKLNAMAEAFQKFPDIFRMKLTEGEWMKVERELHLKTERNFTVWLDLTQGIEKQLKKLKRSLAKLDIYHEPLEYIDLRISGGENEKVIFRRK